MTEIKNNFLGAKMNKDIDDRLLPKNQYRHAENLEINRSDNSDAGTVQNILGNKLMKDFRQISPTVRIEGLDCIGVYADPGSDSLYIFLTNNDSNEYNDAAINYIYQYNPLKLEAKLLVYGAFLNFSKESKILGINVLEEFLFWTDNRNQPRKINITRAVGDPTHYTREDQISVAKLSPLYPVNLYKASSVPAAAGKYETTMYNVATQYIYTGTTPPNPVNDLNPYYNKDYIGDAAYLEDKFVRFSYRYKFEDGEYSIMAPFTQIAYIPKQDGYFMYEGSGVNPVKDDETAAYRSTIVNFMENKVDQIKLQIVMPNYLNPAQQEFEPCSGDLLNPLFKITDIEILYKDANGLAVSVVDSIPVVGNVNFTTTNGVYEYVYNSKKPFKTLPTKDLIRVNDIVPIRALCQEIISNRVVYSNYQNKASYPRYLDFNVGYGDKSTFVPNSSRTSIIEYPNHSVKENRNYQVGVVLADRFGRESGVILSSAISSLDANRFGASSLYVKYREPGSTAPAFYPGTALKILFNSEINSNINGWPGIYNEDVNSPDYNPLGWYSYKIVVKQTEQDYYNVYLPGFMAAYPADAAQELGKTSHTVLINDNINKVPRDLTEVGPAQLQFRSSVTLYPRVENNTELYNNNQFYPGNSYSFVNTIATNNSLFFPNNTFPDPATPAATPYKQFYQFESDPLIARISTPVKVGVVSTAPNVVTHLSIAETRPVDSKLDIYWETSTTGLISDLNALVATGTNGAVKFRTVAPFDLDESSAGGTTVIDNITFNDEINNQVILEPNQLQLVSVFDYLSTPTNVTDKFELQPTAEAGKFKIVTKPNAYFVYQSIAGANKFKFNLISNSGIPLISQPYTIPDCELKNTTPIIDLPIPSTTPYSFDEDTGTVNVVTFTGRNGSADTTVGANQLGLVWSITSTSPNFAISPAGVLTANTDVLTPATYNVTVRLTDAGGITGSKWVERTVVVEIKSVITCSDFTLSGGTTTNNSFTFMTCAGDTKYLTVAPGASTVQCIKLPFSATGATLTNTNCVTPVAGCAVYEFQGGPGPADRIFTGIKECGSAITRNLTVPPNTSKTRCIVTPYLPSIEGAILHGDCPETPTCRLILFTGGDFGHTFYFKECGAALEQPMTLEAGEDSTKCVQMPYYDSSGLSSDEGSCSAPTLCQWSATTAITATTLLPDLELTGSLTISSAGIGVYAEAQGLCSNSPEGTPVCDIASTTVQLYDSTGTTLLYTKFSGLSSGGLNRVSTATPALTVGATYQYVITLSGDGTEGMTGGMRILCPE